ncbi:rod shape-determining protein MreC [Sporosarcina sp. 179-K 8C2 HS]|uniref:rod shape-determining protein MreC n=1 Tax=Sporosarcina sp. 179-K 8C2 HS TaxID=3142387 RepID=UPI0039A19EC0
MQKKIIILCFSMGILALALIYPTFNKTKIKRIVENTQKVLDMYEENKILKERLASFDSIKLELADIKKENKNLVDIIDTQTYLTKELNYPTEVETVLSREYDQWYEELIISSEFNYSPGIVMTSEGLIGKIVNGEDSENDKSVVKLITGSLNNVAASVQTNEELQGIIEGYDRDNGVLQMKILNKYQIEIEKIIGKNVTTTGKGGVYPSGITIGKVIDTKIAEFGLNKILLIEPAADFNDIYDVIVIPGEHK